MSIATQITRLNGAKTSIRNAIVRKGVDVPSSARISDYETYIDQIQTGGGGDDAKKVPFYCENITGAYETWTIHLGYSTSTPIVLEYSYDNENWSTFATFQNSTFITKVVSPGAKMYFRSTTTRLLSTLNDRMFIGMSKVGGNVMSLFYGSNFTGNETTFPSAVDALLYGMFYGNTTLIDAGDLILPMESLSGCNTVCGTMFSGCSSLIKAPKLPATTLQSYCYYQMFYNCTSLEEAPELPATTLVDNCYYYMFYGCTSLKYVKALFTTDITSSTSYTSNWLDNVAPTGSFIKGASATWNRVDASGVPTGWIQSNATSDVIDDTTPFFVENTTTSNQTLSIIKTNTSAPTLTVQYSTDGTTWTSFGSTSTTARTLTVTPGQRVYLRCNTSNWCNASNGYYNAIRGVSKVGGNIMSLLYGSNFTGSETTFPSATNRALAGIFYQNTTVVDASALILPVKNLSTITQAYQYMFYGCTALTKAPELPATTLGEYCYQYMFYGCTALITAPELPVYTLPARCYSRMFYNCTSLVEVPVLNISNSVNSYSCEYMFYGCIALKTVPDLTVTTLATNCYYYMFYGCSSLTKAPKLPATTLATNCYAYMFYNCTSLVEAPDLPATTLQSGCYNYMFNGCTKLHYIKAMFTTTPSTTYCNSWVSNVDTAGIFIKNSSSSWTTTGTSAMPSTWSTKKVSA